MVDPLPAPVKIIAVPLPPATGLIVPEMLKVCAVAVKFTPEMLPPLIVTVRLAGVNV